MRRTLIAAVALTLIASTAAAQNDAGSIQLVAPVAVKAKYDKADLKTVFAALEESYRSAGIKVTERDPVGYVLAHPALETTKKIGNVKAEKAFNCGGDPKSPNAANANLTVSLRSEVREVSGFVEVATLVSATGKLVGSGTPVSCSSLGELEKKLNPTPASMVRPLGPASGTVQGKQARSGPPGA